MKIPSNNIFVQTIDLKFADKIATDLKKQDFEFSIPPHTIFSAKKKGISCTLYKSGKLMVQGKGMTEFIEFYLEPNILGTFTHNYKNLEIDLTARIGVDESGKGDFFGPLCIAGVFADKNNVGRLEVLGVRDSKVLTDKAIITVARAIKKEFFHHIVKINPLKYNELYAQFKNLNSLLAWGHATTIEQLVSKTSCRNVIIDQFANENLVLIALKRKKMDVELTQRHRAETDLVVAAASILARETFLLGLEELSTLFGIQLPKGASQLVVKAARKFISQHGREALVQVAKLHFKTTQQVL